MKFLVKKVINFENEICISVASNKGEAEPERKETRNKVDEDRKHEYPFVQIQHELSDIYYCETTRRRKHILLLEIVCKVVNISSTQGQVVDCISYLSAVGSLATSCQLSTFCRLKRAAKSPKQK